MVPWRGKATLELPLQAERTAAAGERRVPVYVALPGGLEATLEDYVTVLPAVSLAVQPFDCKALGAQATAVKVVVHNSDDHALSGEVKVAAPEGFGLIPGPTGFSGLRSFANLSPGAEEALEFGLTATRAATSADDLKLQVTCPDGARADLVRSLSPTVVDADGDGIADGWQLNPEGGPPQRRNQATASVEPGDREFLCQRVDCTRFSDGWIILHRDGQDHVAKGKRYRVSFRARQRGLKGSLGVAVYNIAPWQSCGIESLFTIGSDWQPITGDFTATRDSDNVRFEFYVTEEGTVWIEGMRLEPANAG